MLKEKSLKEFIEILEHWAPSYYAQEFDKVGLLVGDKESMIKGVLISLDTTEEVLEEALEKECNLIISFHPILFKGIQKLTYSSYVECIVAKAIKYNIALYAIHTNLDHLLGGPHDWIMQKLHLKEVEALFPKNGSMKKLTTYVPLSHLEGLKQVLFKQGAGQLSSYHHCSFTLEGVGSFQGDEQSKPFIGEKNKLHTFKEMALHLFYPSEREKDLIEALRSYHPYQEPIIALYEMPHMYTAGGLGRIGNLEEPLFVDDFLIYLKEKLNLEGFFYNKKAKEKIKNIQRVAFLGGSGSFAIDRAKDKKAHVFISADISYHKYFQAYPMILIDIGHYPCEEHIPSLILNYLKEKMPNFVLLCSEKEKNPIGYFRG